MGLNPVQTVTTYPQVLNRIFSITFAVYLIILVCLQYLVPPVANAFASLPLNIALAGVTLPVLPVLTALLLAGFNRVVKL